MSNIKKSSINSYFTNKVDNTSTEELEIFLQKNKNKKIDKVLLDIDENLINETEDNKKNFSYYLRDKAKSRGLKQKDVSYLAGFSIKYGEKVFMGSSIPSRDAVIRLAFVLKLSIKETNRALRYAKRQPLYIKYKRDAVIMMLLNEEKTYQVYEINDKLEQLGLKTLESNIEE